MWKEVANRRQHKQQERDSPLSAIDNDGENEKRELQNRIDNQDSLDCPNLSESPRARVVLSKRDPTKLRHIRRRGLFRSVGLIRSS